jgi:hypothetical protein
VENHVDGVIEELECPHDILVNIMQVIKGTVIKFKEGKLYLFLYSYIYSITKDRSHSDNFDESLETLPAVESQSWVSF